MKYLFTLLIFCAIYSSTYSQQTDFAKSLSAGKAEFKKEYVDQDYENAIKHLEKAVQINPLSAEAHYFLGYAYDKLNIKDGSMIIESNLTLALKVSKAFETVIKLSPKYTGELLALDPYSKITSTWGSQAMAYLYRGDIDSAKWAFTEGKKRGGFSELSLAINRLALNSCTPGSLLLSTGDNSTYPLLYLQNLENYRTNVATFDIGLLDTYWYAGYLQNNKIVDFKHPVTTLDTLEYTVNKDSLFTLPLENGKPFQWISKSNYNDGVLYRRDRLLLKLLQSRGLKNPVYFTKGFSGELAMDLWDYTLDQVFVHQLNINDGPELTLDSFNQKIKEMYKLIELINPNSTDELIQIDMMRAIVLFRANYEAGNDQEETARKLIKEMNLAIPLAKFPMEDGFLKDFMTQFLD